MISSTADYKAANFASVRQVKAKVELYSGSALAATYTDTDKIISIEIQRVGEDGKFFGFGICHRLNVHLIDKERALTISTDNTLKVSVGVKLADGTVEYKGFPTFEVSEVHRDEKTNELSITAYDALYRASSCTVEELSIEAPYTMKDFCETSGALLGVSVSGVDNFLLSYPNGANFEGTELLRTALDMAAEATQTIYYMNAENVLCFKALDRDGDAIFSIDKARYIELKTSGARRLQTICNTTELGDSISEGTALIGSTQYVRDNAFWELREDIATLVHNAVEAIGNISIEMLECKWRGDAALEVGDKLQLITKDNKAVNTYLLNDVISYDGALSEKTIWKYSDNESETASNPTSIGEALKQTYARVDKANKKITLLASEIDAQKEDIAQLQIEKDNIKASVSQITETQDDLSSAVVDMRNSITEQNKSNAKQFETLTKKVDATMTSEQVQLAITTELSKGAEKVSTSTGFTFDDKGLTISKSNSEISTNIDEDGMSITKGSEEVLTADNTGVKARNLHATTYLIVGQNSRFEDYGSDRTGCFWIGS